MTDQTRPINVLFDGPPDHEAGRFIEVETDDGRSISAGEWIDRGDGSWALRIVALPTVETPAEAGIGTRSPSVRQPHDVAMRRLRDTAAAAHAADVRLSTALGAVLSAYRGDHLGGQRTTFEAHVFAAIAEEVTSPLDAMILHPHQRYEDRADYAVLSVTRSDAHEIAVEVVP
jgi:hypothetical protein